MNKHKLTNMGNKIFWPAAIIGIICLAMPLAAAASIMVQFNNGGNATTTQGTQAWLSGTISADTNTFLNFPANLSITGYGQTVYGNPNFPSINASTTAAFLPATISTTTPFSGALVAVDVPATALLGDYFGFYGIVGGDSASSTNVLISQPFYLHVISGSASSTQAAPTPTPVPSPVPAGFSGLQIPADQQNPSATVTPSTYANGPRLIKLDGDSTVYWVAPNNLKIGMTSAKVFLSYHNKWSDVATVGQAEFDSYPNAKYIWLNGTGAIYKIGQGEKLYVPSNIWNNAGIDAGQIIDINKTDFSSYKNGAAINTQDELTQ